MKESLKSRGTRWMFNLFPCYRRTGVKMTYISPDFHEVRIELPLNWKTRGYNGTTFGGSMYGCIDPVYMTMISWNLGRDYIAWDKAVQIEFRKPGRGTLYSTFRLPQGELDGITRLIEVLGDQAIVARVSVRYVASLLRRCKLYDYERGEWTDFSGRVTGQDRAPLGIARHAP